MISSASMGIEFFIHSEWNGDGNDGVGPLLVLGCRNREKRSGQWSWNFIFSSVGCYIVLRAIKVASQALDIIIGFCWCSRP